MINITMNSKRLKLTVTGHALPEESPMCKEICAAASALAQSMMYSISRYNDGEGTMKSTEYRDQPGDLMIRIWPETWAEREIRHIFNIYADGLELLAESHPQSVTYIKDGERIIAKEEKGNE